MKAERIQVGEVSSVVPLTTVKNSMPMIGWHEQSVDFDVDGETWHLCIGGGCQTINVRPPGTNDYFTVKIGDLLPAMVDAIQKGMTK